MTDKDFEQPDNGDEVLGENDPVVDRGSESPEETPGSSPHEDTDATQSEGAENLTVDDILGVSQNADAAAEDAVIADLESALLNDLKRLQAEYANYRRRTEEQREVEIQRAKGEVAKGLIPVLDDLDRAEAHGDLTEGSAFLVIAEKVRGVTARLGVEPYGAAGEPFDPQHHEAILQAPTPGTTEPTILEVVEIGYRLGTVELRPAKVVVAVPTE